MLLSLSLGLLSVTVFITVFSPFSRLESGNMREPKLRKKKVGKHRYYYTEANGGAYFGKVGDIPLRRPEIIFGNIWVENKPSNLLMP